MNPSHKKHPKTLSDDETYSKRLYLTAFSIGLMRFDEIGTSVKITQWHPFTG